VPAGAARRRTRGQDHSLEEALDNTLIQLCEGALMDASPVTLELPVRNVNRTVGTMLGSLVTRRYGAAGLPDDTIDLTFTGSAGQSFGAFLPPGVTLRLYGDANDHVGKGLSGGRIVVRPDLAAPFRAEENVVAGNVLAYGGDLTASCVRARRGGGAVLRPQLRRDGRGRGRGRPRLRVHDRAGGVVVLGGHGRNLAAGMSGGLAYVLGRRPGAGQPGHGRPGAGVRRRRRGPARDRGGARGADRVAEWPGALLADWDAALGRFTAVVPRDYKRVLEATRRAEEDGRSVDDAIMDAARG